MNRPEPDADKIVVHIPEGLKTLIPEYLDGKRQDLQRMRECLQTNDLDSIKETGHLIKGSGASYGFEELSELGKYLETAAADNRREQVVSLLDRLAHYLSKVEVVYV